MNLRQSRSLVVLVFAAAAAIRAQSPLETPAERIVRIMGNSRLLRVEMVMDRSTYFPGEAATIQVTVTNPTTTALEVPLVTDPEAFDCSVKQGSGWGSVGLGLRPPEIGAPGTLLPPGRTISYTIRTLDKTYRPWTMTGAMPAHPAKLRLRSRLGGSVEFEVGAPLLEKGIFVPLHKTETDPSEAVGEEPVTEQLAALVVAAEIGAEHVVMVSTGDLPIHNTIDTNPDGTLTDGTSHMGTPWIRVATVASKITDLSATTDPLDLITIEFTTADGVRHRVPLDAARHAI